MAYIYIEREREREDIGVFETKYGDLEKDVCTRSKQRKQMIGLENT